jgi:Lrp/AsnC family leucine-responsive transcriptional regulator
MDATDRRIIEHLTANGRLAIAELARQIGLSGPAVHERVGKLESSGVIRAYRAEVDPESVGLGVTAFIGIVASSENGIDAIVDSLAEIPEIDSCYFLAGTESFLLRIRVPTISDLEHLILRLNRTPGVASTRTTIALSTKWENRPHQLPPE